MNSDKETKAREQERKSPFKDDAEKQTASAENGQDTTSVEEDSEAEQQRKEALSERD